MIYGNGELLNGGWIPVRLPEKGKKVLFTTNEGYVCTGVWDGKRYFDDDEGRAIEISEITAWMPLPKPYKKESMTYGFCVYHELECDYNGRCVNCPHNTEEDTEWFIKQDESQAESEDD